LGKYVSLLVDQASENVMVLDRSRQYNYKVQGPVLTLSPGVLPRLEEVTLYVYHDSTSFTKVIKVLSLGPDDANIYALPQNFRSQVKGSGLVTVNLQYYMIGPDVQYRPISQLQTWVNKVNLQEQFGDYSALPGLTSEDEVLFARPFVNEVNDRLSLFLQVQRNFLLSAFECVFEYQLACTLISSQPLAGPVNLFETFYNGTSLLYGFTTEAEPNRFAFCDQATGRVVYSRFFHE